ncbi:hypothetical protein LOTGIDRAFT_234704 [Lottia gigantea]|uniref:A-kinase anchor protein 2 C-terminal domain-containing protein n=1 Tax=Lottia gigantea TaxID=225164 RepID=V4A4F5_LOTGI|nr:hypothetical protein LOTGIDRAFT_234704 [Lottia gigantea]ESO88141.1 hypothetical protein LOTGIDRAFT_234704 [Lottia gigantea]
MAENESAIDREIRLANEREELLRREKEERLKLEEQQNGRLDISSFENVAKSPPVNKPLYHEMTEADRGSEMWQRETLIQQELREQEERELALKRKSLTPVRNRQDSETTEEVPYESIIQREIRLQKEKEEELEKQRTKKDIVVDTISSQPSTPKQTVITNDNNSVQNDINHNEQKVNVCYEDAISGFQHEGESLIAREMRELREREEEVRRQRELALNTSRDSLSSISTPPKSASSNSIPHSSSSSSLHPKQGTWQKDVSPYIQPIDHKRSASVDSLASSQSTGRTPSDCTPSRDIKVMPNVQDDSDDEETPKHTPSSETPIQREIRLARERENELRRSKGLPEIAEPKQEQTTPKQKSQNDITGTPTSSYSSPRYHRDNDGQAVRSYASSRLQQELSSQKERELLYRKEGRIITTSEEHIEPLKYKEVTGMDQVDGPVKRNFNTKKSSNMNSLQSPENINIVVEETTTPTRQTSSPVKAVKGGSGAQFSYKESRQTAESKIERELREMREREQELRKKNNPDLNEEDEPESPRETTLNQKTAGPDGQTRSLADQWAQICQS